MKHSHREKADSGISGQTVARYELDVSASFRPAGPNLIIVSHANQVRDSNRLRRVGSVKAGLGATIIDRLVAEGRLRMTRDGVLAIAKVASSDVGRFA